MAPEKRLFVLLVYPMAALCQQTGHAQQDIIQTQRPDHQAANMLLHAVFTNTSSNNPPQNNGFSIPNMNNTLQNNGSGIPSMNNILQNNGLSIPNMNNTSSIQNNGSGIPSMNNTLQNNGLGLPSTNNSTLQNNGLSIPIMNNILQNNGLSIPNMNNTLQNNGLSNPNMNNTLQNNGLSNPNMNNSTLQNNGSGIPIMNSTPKNNGLGTPSMNNTLQNNGSGIPSMNNSTSRNNGSGIPTMNNTHYQLPPPPSLLTIMTFNLLFGETASDDAWQYSWKNRSNAAFDIIRRYEPTIIGLQEPQEEQKNELLATFGHIYQLFPHEFPFVSIMFDTRVVRLEDSGLFWLSDTPDVEWSRFNESTDSRATTWGRFRLVESTGDNGSDVFYVFNTWLESWEAEPRLFQADLTLTKIREIVQPVLVNVNGSTPTLATPAIFLIGDMNCNRSELPWELITGNIYIPDVSGDFLDAWQTARNRTNPVRDTWHDFKACEVRDMNGSGHIDYVIYRPPTISTRDGLMWQLKQVDVLEAAVVIDGNDDGNFPSDHFPVVATFSFS